MKVYLATAGEYSDYRVVHVFAREKDARAYKLADDVEEREIEEGPVEVRTWHRLHWSPCLGDRAGESLHLANPYESSELADFPGGWDAGHSWITDDMGHPRLTVSGWDLERVRKVYSEQRAKYLAEIHGV